MSNHLASNCKDATLPADVAALLEEVKDEIGAAPLSAKEIESFQAALRDFTDSSLSGDAQGSYRDTVYQDRYSDQAYRDSSTYADTPSYRDAAR